MADNNSSGTMPEQRSDLSIREERINEISHYAHDLLLRTTEIADRVYGPIEETVDPSSDKILRSGSLNNLDSQLDRVESFLTQTSTQIFRLQNI
jgi:hypothetical protein